MDLRACIAALLGLAAVSLATALAEPFRTPHVETELVSSRVSAAPGETIWIALRQDIIPGWHTYWRNPGDSGEPTEITAWRLPAGFVAGDLNWQAPEAIPFDILVNYGYAGEVLFPIQLTVPASAALGSTARIEADVDWLVCSDICIPEEGAVSLALPIAASGRDDPNWSQRIAEAVAALPRAEGVAAHIAAGEPARLSVALDAPQQIRNPAFFPYSRDAIAHAEPQSPSFGARGVTLSLAPGAGGALGRGELSGVLTFEAQDGLTWTRRAVEVNAAPGDVLPETSGAGPPAGGAADLGLPLALLFAFIGGLILNIMPCVLPVLAIKALSFAGVSNAGEARRHGLFYLAGVIATFLALAGALIALRGAGQALGWGFQLQSPWISGALALLFFVIGLNLLGVFEIKAGQNFGQKLTARGGEIGALFTGALAVLAAAPCTAPFMAAAAGFALSASPPITLLVFLALALGFAAPLVLLSFAPALQRLLPKPGAWMERLKNLLAFPMFGAAIWLAWVVTAQLGANGALALLSLAAALAFALFVSRWGRAWIVAGLVVLAAAAAFALPLAQPRGAAQSLAEDVWSPARVAELRAAGRPVFVDFTATWCVTCQVNKATVFTRPRLIEALRTHNVAFLTADWTNRDDAIAAELARHGRAGVPLYLYYPPGAAAPQILPQILSEDIVLRALEGGGS
jgi:thiol:disulfide interchange protein DsbD